MFIICGSSVHEYICALHTDTEKYLLCMLIGMEPKGATLNELC